MPRLTLAILGCLILGRHPLHTTHTDLAEGPGGRVSVTVRSFSDDLRMAVSRREHATSDSAIARYVRQSIELRDPAGRPLPIAWDSVRREGDITLLSFHTTSAGGVRGVTVRQVMQMELYDDQVNVLQARFAGRSVSLLFLPGDGPKELQ